MVLISLAIFAATLVLLIKGSDFFVDSVARIAKRLGVSEFVIGLTIVAIGTSMPELASSIAAAYAGQTELAVGNIIGSNLANIGLILGLSAIVVAIGTNKVVLFRDCMIMSLASALFFLFSADGTISSFEGVMLLSMAIFYTAYLLEFHTKLRKEFYRPEEYLRALKGFDRFAYPRTYMRAVGRVVSKKTYTNAYKKANSGISNGGFFVDVLAAVAGLIVISLSSIYMVPAAVDIAVALGVTKNVIGATLIAVGTSLPELFVSISSIKKGFTGLLLGNIIGSNIYNLTLIGGVSALISPLVILPTSFFISIPFMLLITGALVFFVWTWWTIRRFEGVGLFLIYAAFIGLLLANGSSP